MMEDCRIDKFLWLIRLFRTRADATDACKKGIIYINQNEAKPSKNIKKSDKIELKRNNIIYSFIILDIPKSRIGNKLVQNYINNITEQEQLDKLEIFKIEKKNQRAKGLGRPTKKERRDIDNIFNM